MKPPVSTFEPFEKIMVRKLVNPYLSDAAIGRVLEGATPVSYETTGVGYFLTVRHPSVPQQRMVCDEPGLTGVVDGVSCGFVAFLENGELTLDCHFWGEIPTPRHTAQALLSPVLPTRPLPSVSTAARPTHRTSTGPSREAGFRRPRRITRRAFGTRVGCRPSRSTGCFPRTSSSELADRRTRARHRVRSSSRHRPPPRARTRRC